MENEEKLRDDEDFLFFLFLRFPQRRRDRSSVNNAFRRPIIEERTRCWHHRERKDEIQAGQQQHLLLGRSLVAYCSSS